MHGKEPPKSTFKASCQSVCKAPATEVDRRHRWCQRHFFETNVIKIQLLSFSLSLSLCECVCVVLYDIILSVNVCELMHAICTWVKEFMDRCGILFSPRLLLSLNTNHEKIALNTTIYDLFRSVRFFFSQIMILQVFFAHFFTDSLSL